LFADAYLHPENPVVLEDGAAMGRNYFERPSAVNVNVEEEEEEERAQVLKDALKLKKLAMDYMHPELPVVSSDSTACARNYFHRASALGQDEDADERAEVLADAMALKRLAVDYMHPEMPVAMCTYATAFGRNYFDRPSAAQDDDAEERAQVLADAMALKKLAVEYMHPEMSVVCTDATACARNYFDRASAAQDEDAEERAQVLAEAAALKKLAVDYMHPEMQVVCTDTTLFGRNYFTRPSAAQDENAEERGQVLADAMALKKLAIDYMHPEMPAVCTDDTACARNYFTRSSAAQEEDAEERAQVLADAAALKKLAMDYTHPEMPVVCTDATAFGRNYFTRPSAERDEDDADERAQILLEAAALKRFAMDYMHPENIMVCAFSFVSARNFFTRASAAVDHEYAQERAEALADTAALKRLAVDYMHPEKPVVCTDATLFGRNYFTRPSAAEQEVEDSQEGALALADVAALKRLAVDYMHPELPVVSSDATCFGRNYFTRHSAPTSMQDADAEERAQVLADMAGLKRLAVDYMHPEMPVVCTDATLPGRNYFTRPSAPLQMQEEDVEEREQILADAATLKQLAITYYHPEMPVVCTDATLFGRNYFTRPSAPLQLQEEAVEERVQVLADMAALKKLAVDYMHPEMPVVCDDPCARARTYFERYSAPEVEHPVEAAQAAHKHAAQAHFEEEVMSDTIRDTLRKFQRSHSIGQDVYQEARMISKEEEGHLSHSPSSVMLFDMMASGEAR
jgi:predicted transcriptional regulator